MSSAMITPAGGAREALEHEEKKSLEAREFGFWIYLMTDAVLFALLFATYAVLAGNFADGPTSKELFDLGHVAGETALLLLSSLTFGFATLAMGEDRAGRVIQWLALTLVLGVCFLAMEMVEFYGMIEKGAGPDVSGFLSAFFALVGTHGLHVAFGAIGICVMIGQVMVKGLTLPVRSRLIRLGLFWHFLDIVWIGIFSVVYLPGVM
ncbi:cytochrome o ubiquinol oxidase subunit III [Roseibium denhamense]|uniref:Cytochrome bo(3) ubiquinol oxidase subunit 3 n=1 Tax=Roseibium denhamense TaxID=76305 RepID=A0ABY1N7Y2_9HYPH|nr:cytochrome o ubiquinol oxidase subunit III [Roseibium denhamense]MTI06002.1 cytochrome o ubiquinol oxidase subunit III [Roseibium denhamense]SMP02132.1 cytochrome bo3 quinol oxidase subunit 3 [Roseibium denhamense]